MVICLQGKKKVSNKLLDARKAHEWLSNHPKILVENVGKWICLSTDRVIGIGSTLREAMQNSSSKEPSLVLKVPSNTAAYAIQHRVR